VLKIFEPNFQKLAQCRPWYRILHRSAGRPRRFHGEKI